MSRADAEAKPREGSAALEQPVEKDITPVPKAWRILYSDLKEHGFTEGCAQCMHNELHGKSRDGMSHIPKCRQRILEKPLETLHGRARLEAYEGTKPWMTGRTSRRPTPPLVHEKRQPQEEFPAVQAQEELPVAQDFPGRQADPKV